MADFILKKMEEGNPVKDISACFNAVNKNAGYPNITYISEETVDLVKGKTGRKTVKDLESKYAKRYPDSHPLKIRTIHKKKLCSE